MDLIANLLAEKKNDLTAMLVKNAGFGSAQAATFVPAATEAVAQAAGGTSGLDPKALAGLNVSQLIGKVDIGALASKTGVDKGMATAGLTSLVPVILEALKGKLGIGGGLAGVAGQLAGGAGLAGAAKGVGGLFKR